MSLRRSFSRHSASPPKLSTAPFILILTFISLVSHTFALLGGTSITRSDLHDLSSILNSDPSLVNVSLPTLDLSAYSPLTARYLDGTDLYLGGRNILLNISLLSSGDSAELRLINSASAEPQNDDGCLPLEGDDACSCPNRENKITTIYADQNIVVACGSRAQGRCFIYNKKNISQSRPYYSDPYHPEQVIASAGSTVLFPGKIYDADLRKNMDVYYVGFEDDCRRRFDSPPHHSVPFISARVNQKSPVYAKRDRNFGPWLIRPHDPNYKSHFIYGFDGDDYAYFVTIHTAGGSRQETRIGRICHKDENFNSYTEIPVKCGEYSVASGATHFTQLSGDKFYDKTLILAFNGDKTSAVCHYRLTDIDTMFSNATRNCFDSGSHSQLLPEFEGSQTNCALVEPTGTGDDDKLFHEKNLCSREKNQHILGRVPLEPSDDKPLLKLNEGIHSIAAEKNPHDHDKGQFILVVVTKGSRIVRYDFGEDLNATINLVVPLGPGSLGPKVSPVYSHKTLSFIVMTTDSLIRVPVNDCSIYTSCSTCSLRNHRCLFWKGACTYLQKVPPNQRSTTCPPEVYSYAPNNGPLAGGTVLTFHGTNFGNTKPDDPDDRMDITLGDRKCVVSQRNNTVARCTVDENSPADKDEKTVSVVVSAKRLNSNDIGYYIDGKAIAEVPFRFVSPTVRGIYPAYGPYHGGTNIMIYGSNLDAGKRLDVTFGENEFKCHFKYRQESYAVCKTNGLKKSDIKPNMGALQVNVKIDSFRYVANAQTNFTIKYDGREHRRCELEKDFHDGPFCAKINRFLEQKIELPMGESFQYLPDPEVTEAENMNAIKSGNVVFTFRGKNLGSSAFPVMAIFAKNFAIHSATLLCSVRDNQTVLECPMTEESLRNNRWARSKESIKDWMGKELTYKLRFDGLNIDRPEKMKVYEDPVFDSFTSTNVPNGKVVEFTGKNLEPTLPYKIELKSPKNEVFQCSSIVGHVDAKLRKLWCHVNISDEKLNNIEGYDLDVNIAVGKSLSYAPGNVRFESSGFAWFPAILIFLVCAILVGIGVLKITEQFHRPKNDGSVPLIPINSNWKLDLETIFFQNSTENKKFGPLFEKLDLVGMIINPETIVVAHQLGTGNFGIVVKATYEAPQQDGKTVRTEVAIKMQRSGDAGYHEFISEADIMWGIEHPNVMKLLGVTLIEGKPGIVLPYMDGKDLKNYITHNNCTVRDLLNFGMQIANGMVYLSEKNCVHRDLALRNCMVRRDNPPTVFVADFGLTRTTNREYYQMEIKEDKALPMKWMAPETLRQYKYTTKSDVYSYGVTLWELMTRGMIPYEFFQQEELLHHLENGYRLEMPEVCPDLIYIIMMKCWNDNPDDRPTFREVYEELEDSIEVLQNTLDQEQSYENSYFLRYYSTRQNMAQIDYRQAETQLMAQRAREEILQNKIGVTFDPSRELEADRLDTVSESLPAHYQFINELPPDYSQATGYPNGSYRSAIDYSQSGPSNRATAPPMSFKNGY